MGITKRRLLAMICFLLGGSIVAAGAPYKYSRVGNEADVSRTTKPGFALMGGGTDLDEAFEWMCDRANGGDFLVIRATGSDDYNAYIQKLCKVNSVATLVIPDKEAAQDPRVAAIIQRAEALFISGGDQSNYIKYWQGTPVQTELNSLIKKGVPLGGTSAGLAVMGQFIFSAMNDSAFSKETLANPYNERVTIASNFLAVPHLEKVITDMHFATRDRQGRLVGFMARVLQDGMSREVRGMGVDEKSALLVEPDGAARAIGTGKGVYFYHPSAKPETCRPGKRLTFEAIAVEKISTGQSFSLSEWKGQGTSYTLNLKNGVLTTTAPGGSVY